MGCNEEAKNDEEEYNDCKSTDKRRQEATMKLSSLLDAMQHRTANFEVDAPLRDTNANGQNHQRQRPMLTYHH